MQDLTVGNESKQLLWFTLPMMVSQLLQVSYSLVDGIIVGNFIGASALGAIGICNPFVWLLNAIQSGFGVGISIMAAQYFGANRKEDLHRAVTTAFFAGGVLFLLLTTLFEGLAQPLLAGFLATPEEMMQHCLPYFRIYCLGIGFQLLYNLCYGVLRAFGDSKGAMLFLLIAAGANLILDVLLVAVWPLGVAGAAIATIAAQGGSAAASAIYLFMRYPQMRFTLRQLRPQPEKLRMLVSLGVPAMLKSAVSSIGFLFLQKLVNSFGTPSIEGFSAMNRTENLLHIPSLCFSQAISSFAGQNIGAGKPDRALSGYHKALWMANGCCIALMVVMCFAGRPLLTLFAISGESLQRAWEHLMIIAFSLCLTSTGNIANGFLQGSGDVRATVVSSFANLGVRLLTAYLLAQTFVDYRSIYVSIPLAWLIGMLIPLIRIRSGRWKQKKIL